MYGKIFEQIFDSSIAEDYQVRHVFADLIILAGRDGVIDMTPEAISRRTNVPLDVIMHALAELEKPDPKSRSSAKNGARIVRLDKHRTWGWKIVNHATYRNLGTKFEMRVTERERKRIYRLSHSSSKSVVRDNSGQPGTNADLPASASVSASASESESVPPEEPKPRNEKYHPDARTVLHVLNETSGRHFRELDVNLAIISARLREPEVTLEGVRQMIKRQCARWRDTPQAEYLRPETLFGKTKFESYYTARDLPVIHEHAQRTNPGHNAKPAPVKGSSPVNGF